MNRIQLIYVTTSSPEEARKIGRLVVEERLAACVNIIDGMHSIYRWENEIQSGQESILIIKTRTALVLEVMKRVEEVHSNKTPAVLAIEVREANHTYIDWLFSETRPEE